MSAKAAFNIYYMRRNNCKTKFPCPVCFSIVSSREYEKSHARQCLGVDTAEECLWCRGRYTWPRLNKKHHVNHLLECWKRFIDSTTLTPAAGPSTALSSAAGPSDAGPSAAGPSDALPSTELIQRLVDIFELDDPELLCPGNQFFGFSKISQLPDLAYEKELYQAVLHIVHFFRNENINVGIACLRLFFEGKYDFYHIMVRAVAFRSFMDAMESDPETRLLPFSCWCDGGDPRLEPIYRQHRHMIAISPKEPRNRFQTRVWSKVKIPKEDQPFKYYRCTYKKPILSGMHLVHTMGYLSKRESRCNGSFGKTVEERENEENEEEWQKTKTSRMNHFCIMAPLPKSFRLPLVLTWYGGYMEELDQRYKKLKPETVSVIPSVRKYNGVWKIPVKDLPGIKKGLVLLVSKELRPMGVDLLLEEDHPYVLRLNEGRALIFERDDSLNALDDSTEWGRVQADGGNAFHAVVGDELFTLGKNIQSALDAVERVRWENDQLRKEIEHIREEKHAEIAQIREEKHAEIAQIREEKESLKTKCQTLEREKEKLKRKCQTLEREKEKLNRKCQTLERENEKLKRKIWTVEVAKIRAECKMALEQKDAEIARINAEIARKDVEIAQVRTECKMALEQKDAEIVRINAEIARKDVQIRTILKRKFQEQENREPEKKCQNVHEDVKDSS